MKINDNGLSHRIDADPGTPLLYRSTNRRSFLKAGAALVVSFNLPAVLQSAFAESAPLAPPQAHDPKMLDAWIALNRDGTVTVYMGKVELGQGATTSLMQIVAEELDLHPASVVSAQVETDRSMNQGATNSSGSIERAGPQLRSAAAEVRRELLRRASRTLGVPMSRLQVNDGIVSGGGRTVAYTALLDKEMLEIAMTGDAPQKDSASYKVVGTSVPRRDIPAKVMGTHRYVQHATLPGMLHGRVVRPRGQSAYGANARIVRVDTASIRHIKNVRIVRRGDFLGVVAPRQWDAICAAQALEVEWDIPAALPGHAHLHEKMRAAKATVTELVADGNAAEVSRNAKYVVEGQFRAPYQAHASFAPSCALANVGRSHAQIICSSQDVFALRDRMAPVLDVALADINVSFMEGSGCYGHNCQDDVAIAAAIMSQETGRPVRVQFMRWDEMGWDNFGPAHVGEIAISADKNGKLSSYEYHGWHHGWMIEETSEQLATGMAAHELSKGYGSLAVNKFDAGGMYEIPNWHLVNHAVDGLDGYLKGANLRSPMDLNYSFASEQAIDELAHLAEIDPIEFRRRNIKNSRWLGVLEAIASASGWKSFPASDSVGDNKVSGRGVALGTHRSSMGGAIADVEVNRLTGEVLVKHVYVALDCGTAINPDIVENQIIGMTMQGVSRVLIESVTFSQTNVTSLDWHSYPVLRFGGHPNVTPIVLTNTGPALGAGEEALPAVGAAVANAIFNACGARLHEFPMTPARILAAMA